MDVVLDNLDDYLEAMRTTAILTVVSFAVAMAIGVVIATFRVSPVPPLRLAGTVWVEALRNTPLAVLFLLFFFGLPKVGILYSPLVSSLIILSMYTSTYVAETVRAGINSVSRGQAEAARSLGLTFVQVLAGIVMPQALRTVVAPLGSVLIALIKNSGIASTIAVMDLTGLARALGDSTAQPVATFAGAAVGYLILALPAGWGVGVLERRVAIKR
ncbi:MAG TPA: amino acid ABC transporter permease [Acidimicrobiales bacterium]|nr:amino acid ABC transporter permease [Acidimicrobiales bacterium]